MATFLTDSKGNVHRYFDNLQFSTSDFYSIVEAEIRDRKIPDVSFSRVNLSQGGMFSAKREYLRITRRGQSIDVCAAPFARGFFVSSWHGEKDDVVAGLMSRIPIIGIFFDKKAQRKTYFQMDTEAMYKQAVAGAVMDAVDKMTSSKSVRSTAENQVQVQA